MTNHPVKADMFHADEQTDRQITPDRVNSH